MRGLLRLASALLVALAAAACATAPSVPGRAEAPGAAPALPSPARPSAREQLAARHRAQAEALERDGLLRRALDEWKIARMVNPSDAAAREGQIKLEARIEEAVAARIEEARGALARGSHVEARRRLLTALALDPGSRMAFEVLQNEAREVEFITHTVRAGETLAALAQRYYGDRSRSEVIWETNQLPANPRLVAGTTLKIPEIPGLPFLRPEARREAPPAAPRPEAAPATPERGEAPREEPPEVNPLLADARDALEQREYTLALADVDKYLAGSPNNREGLDLKKLALYRQGKEQLDQKKYDESYRTLTQLAKLEPRYEDVAQLLQQARSRTIEQHYRDGIRLYREEKLREAIQEWQVVLDLDPRHLNARRNIEQAERLLKGLEQRKKR
ncbi:MAG: LysM domain-containing protein [candidate division NC10 bacterium]